MFKGAFTAIVTPFKNGSFDEEGYRKLIEFQISEGINGIVPCGTTGESATLSFEEHTKVVEAAVSQANKRVPIFAGTGSNNTKEAIELTLHAKKAGADAALIITPYYNKPTQEGLYQHFKKLAEETKFPIIMYNVPGRTSVNMLPDTVARCAEIPYIVGIKEATGSLQQISKVIELAGDHFCLLSGDDFTVLPTLAVGGKGVISVVSNIVPKDMALLCKAFFDGNINEAKRIHYKLNKLNEAMFFETNPIPVKTSLTLMGKIGGEVRLPLCQMSEANLSKLKNVLKNYSLIN